MSAHPTPRAMIKYGILAMPLAFAGMPLYIYAPDFYATQYGLSLAALGSILLLLRCFDAVQDPLIGYLSDRYHRHLLPIMILAAAGLVGGVAGLFHPPASINHSIWFIGTMLVATTCFSILSINLNALGGVWHSDSHIKTRISAYREIFGVVGLFIAVLLPGVLMQSMPASDAFTWLSVALALLSCIAMAIFINWYRHHATNSIRLENNARIWCNIPRSARTFYAVYGVSMLASSIPALLVLFFIRDRLQAESYMGLFLAVYFISAGLSMPLWSRLSRHIGKGRAWIAGMLVAVVSFVWAYMLGDGDIAPYVFICLISGAGLGADLVLPPSMLADTIQRHGLEMQASSHYAMLAFLSKMALALASFIVFPLLEYSGYRPAADNSETVLHTLSLVYALIPCFIKLAGAGLLLLIIRTQGDYHETINSPDDRSATHA
jgi:GPH family glycoside/pentoside/hexuronide:cation symporter